MLNQLELEFLDAFLAIGTMTIVLVIVIFLAITLILGALFLLIGLKLVQAEETGFGTAFVTNLIGVLLGFIPCIGCLVYWLVIIPKRHDCGKGAALGALLISWVLPYIIVFAIIFLVFPTFLAVIPFLGGMSI